ncbi:energy transducer TonB [Flavobacteriaceae bacterium KMM 6897]|nr:energy transducer TonB [Flavobacteriaceae bacterium KMM 6897]MEB8345900.1 energy transducer TonB [Flavobacteriaceae bacterium KMM 6898]
MKLKKYPKADLNRNSGLYFVIGLALVLFLTWRALEYKTYKKEINERRIVEILEAPKEDVPIIEAFKIPPPPAPPAAPVIIQVVEDVKEIEETVIQSTESSQETVVEKQIITVEEIEVVEEEEELVVPFAVIENVPVFPGCENTADNEAQKECFQSKVTEHVRNHFTYPRAAVDLGIQGRVYVQFIIDTQGNITNIATRGPHAYLEKEAHRIISKLPNMTPGKQRGRAVKVPYSMPITFKLEDG